MRCKKCGVFLGKKEHICKDVWNKGTKGLIKPNPGSFQKGQISWNKGKKLSPLSDQHKQKQSIGLKKYYATNPDLTKRGKNISSAKKKNHPYKDKKLPIEWVEKIRKANKGKKRSKEARKNISKGKVGHSVPEEIKPLLREVLHQGRLKQAARNRPTFIEKVVYDYLEFNKIVFEKNKPIDKKYIVDAYISDFNLVIEVDGMYWHSKPLVVEKDIRENKYLKERGFNLIRLSEKEVKDKSFEKKLRKLLFKIY